MNGPSRSASTFATAMAARPSYCQSISGPTCHRAGGRRALQSPRRHPAGHRAGGSPGRRARAPGHPRAHRPTLLLLPGGSRTARERFQTLQAAVDWSCWSDPAHPVRARNGAPDVRRSARADRVTIVRFAWFTGVPRCWEGSVWRSCRRARSVSCSLISRAQPVSGKSIPKRCARRWRVTTRSCVARSSPTAASWSRRRGTGSMRRSRRRRMRSRPRPTRSSAWPANRGRGRARCECAWVFIRGRRKSATVTTTAPR